MKRPSVTPRAFLELSRPPWFQKGLQQDCSEYLKFLLDKLQTECGGHNASDCDINKFVTGKLKTSVRCCNCETISEREELFNDIPLSFNEVLEGGGHTLKGGNPSDTLKRKMNCSLSVSSRGDNETMEQSSSQSADISTPQTDGGGESSQESSCSLSVNEMFYNYLNPEYLKDSNQYYCNKCEALQNAVKTIEITQFPSYLILTIKRFTYNIATQKRSKLLHVVRHPQTFSVCGGCPRCQQRRLDKFQASSDSHLKGTDNIIDDQLINCENVHKFRLSSFVVHSGYSSESGHYYSYMCEYDGVDYPDAAKCYLLNDSRVTASSLDAISNLSTTFPRDTPYIYIYEKHVDNDDDMDDCRPHFEMKKRLKDFVENDDAIYEMVS